MNVNLVLEGRANLKFIQLLYFLFNNSNEEELREYTSRKTGEIKSYFGNDQFDITKVASKIRSLVEGEMRQKIKQMNPNQLEKYAAGMINQAKHDSDIYDSLLLKNADAAKEQFASRHFNNISLIL